MNQAHLVFPSRSRSREIWRFINSIILSAICSSSCASSGREGPDWFSDGWVSFVSSKVAQLSRLVHALVEVGDLLYPLPPVVVRQVVDTIQVPVEMIGDIGYLLVQGVEGIACYSPPRLDRFISNSLLQWGQVITRNTDRFSFICW